MTENNEDKIEPVYRMVAARMVSLRETLGWSQQYLADRIGLSRASIANIEASRQRLALHDVELLALAFGMSTQHFMRGIWFIDGRKKK